MSRDLHLRFVFLRPRLWKCCPNSRDVAIPSLRPKLENCQVRTLWTDHKNNFEDKTNRTCLIGSHFAFAMMSSQSADFKWITKLLRIHRRPQLKDFSSVRTPRHPAGTESSYCRRQSTALLNTVTVRSCSICFIVAAFSWTPCVLESAPSWLKRVPHWWKEPSDKHPGGISA